MNPQAFIALMRFSVFGLPQFVNCEKKQPKYCKFVKEDSLRHAEERTYRPRRTL